MKLLELVAGGSEAVKTAFAVQRRMFEKELDFSTIDLTKMRLPDRVGVFKSVGSSPTPPDAVLLRGIDQVSEATAYLGKIPLYVDHCTPFSLGRTSPIRMGIMKAKRIYCYSEKVDAELRRTGTGRITAVPGPYLSFPEEREHFEEPTIAVLDTCSKSREVLSRILKVKNQQGWMFDVVSNIPHSGVRRVKWSFEAVEQAGMVVAPYEDVDFGQPHDGAILAMAMFKPLVSVRTGAFNAMGFPAKNFIAAQKYQIGTYVAAVGNYLRNRPRYDEWTTTKADPFALPRDLIERVK